MLQVGIRQVHGHRVQCATEVVVRQAGIVPWQAAARRAGAGEV